MLDHRRSAFVGLSLILKFGLDPIFSFGDIVIFIVCRFCLNLPIHAHSRTHVHVRYLSSSVRLSVVCLYSITFVRPTQAIEIFGNIFTPFGTMAIYDLCIKFYGDRPRGTPPSGELNRRGVVEYSDFGPIDGNILETVQDRRYSYY